MNSQKEESTPVDLNLDIKKYNENVNKEVEKLLSMSLEKLHGAHIAQCLRHIDSKTAFKNKNKILNNIQDVMVAIRSLKLRIKEG